MNVNAQIITIGDEILLGQTVDTNSAWMGQALKNCGIRVKRVLSVADDRQDILDALKFSEDDEKIQVVLITGGLGPTKDDITKHTLCDYFETELELNEAVLKPIKEFFESRGLALIQSNIDQAKVPKSCRLIPNEKGTAAGMVFERNNTIFVSMPGVPYEMKHMMEKYLVPEFIQRFKLSPLQYRMVLTQGIGESFLAEKIGDWEMNLRNNGFTLAYLPSPGIVKLRIGFNGSSKSVEELNEEVEKLKAIIPDYIYAFDDERIEEVLGRLLREKKLKLATAESCTGGNIARLITSVPGSSDYYVGSIISYSNEIKMDLLGVNAENLKKHGAVSQQVVEQMAEGVRQKLGVDVAMATSGIAGPDGGTEEKPVGTIWIAISTPKGTKSRCLNTRDLNRKRNIDRASLQTIDMLRKELLDEF